MILTPSNQAQLIGHDDILLTLKKLFDDNANIESTIKPIILRKDETIKKKIIANGKKHNTR